ncbi:WD40 repeat-like protein [Wallemia mellicola]|uniref:WD40 repeat-like protein n=1 Tax=Wallemia mellicola TaxID=1708541 RepID=A0A4T0P7H8_9BASI|nr:WD40 repeat-like protein [Wallemia mellicola]TIB79183.1 hypothetical protein E3Q23_00268 [Wallemia mellicola]TIB91241.1 WD40 repeat-like protein [Wallemia mellicola]TIC06280.1 WD40 repeat-like protein [Wallemia mellicola]TIC17379.1 WD40 repeat-like protein [Wallemia mellicola]
MEQSREILRELTPRLLASDLAGAKERVDRVTNEDLSSYPIPSTSSSTTTPLIRGYEATRPSNYNRRKLASNELSKLQSLNSTKRDVLSEEIDRVENQISKLNTVKKNLQIELRKTQEIDLELSDQLSQNPFSHPEYATFLPDEHDDLPINKPFMSMQAHGSAINDLTLDKPYGHLITASEDPSMRVWNMSTGLEEGQLIGHTAGVTRVQMEQNRCVSGSEDATLHIWDTHNRSNLAVFTGHTQRIDALQFSQSNLVSGASDKTVRLWDMTSGQCKLTMDLLAYVERPQLRNAGPPFIGGLQFYYNALITGSADSVVRMWDMRTGLPHRNLLGHMQTIWDLRTGKVLNSLHFESPIKDLQFDSRKIMIAGVNDGLALYNRVSDEYESLKIGSTVNTLEYLDTYMVTVMNFLINQTTRRAFPMAQRTFQTTAKTMFSDGFWDAPKLTYKDIKPLTKAPTEDRVLIDVREANEVIQGGIPSSVNLPLSNFEHALDLDDAEFRHLYGFDKPTNGIDDKRNFIFYCRSGKRSATACDLAIRRGIKNIHNYQGSYIDWLEQESKNKEEEDDD